MLVGNRAFGKIFSVKNKVKYTLYDDFNDVQIVYNFIGFELQVNKLVYEHTHRKSKCIDRIFEVILE